jgi:hypothetical protein
MSGIGRVRPVAAELLRPLEAVEAGHPHIKHDQVRGIRERPRETCPSVLRLDHLDPGQLEVHRAERPDTGVVDQEHARPRLAHCHHSRGAQLATLYEPFPSRISADPTAA